MRGNIEATGFELLCVAVATEQFDQFRSKVACVCFYVLMRYLYPRNKEGEEDQTDHKNARLLGWAVLALCRQVDTVQCWICSENSCNLDFQGTQYKKLVYNPLFVPVEYEA